MSYNDLLIVIIIGGSFVLLGILGVIWGKREEGTWYGSISERLDVREFLYRSPGRPEPNALRTGAKICFAVGLVLLLVGIGFRLWGMEVPV